jgi:exodeoxyribonuclease VII small subunit
MADPKFNFEQALTELEGITQWFESSDADLDQGLVKFERGMELAAQLKTHLAAVENRVEKIKTRFAAAPGSRPPAPAAPPQSEAGEDSQAGLFGA